MACAALFLTIRQPRMASSHVTCRCCREKSASLRSPCIRKCVRPFPSGRLGGLEATCEAHVHDSHADDRTVNADPFAQIGKGAPLRVRNGFLVPDETSASCFPLAIALMSISWTSCCDLLASEARGLLFGIARAICRLNMVQARPSRLSRSVVP